MKQNSQTPGQDKIKLQREFYYRSNSGTCISPIGTLVTEDPTFFDNNINPSAPNNVEETSYSLKNDENKIASAIQLLKRPRIQTFQKILKSDSLTSQNLATRDNLLIAGDTHGTVAIYDFQALRLLKSFNINDYITDVILEDDYLIILSEKSSASVQVYNLGPYLESHQAEPQLLFSYGRDDLSFEDYDGIACYGKDVIDKDGQKILYLGTHSGLVVRALLNEKKILGWSKATDISHAWGSEPRIRHIQASSDDKIYCANMTSSLFVLQDGEMTELTPIDDNIATKGLQLYREELLQLLNDRSQGRTWIKYFKGAENEVRIRELPQMDVALSLYHRAGSDYLLVTGPQILIILDGEEIIYQIKLEDTILNAIISENDEFILLITSNGNFQRIPWKISDKKGLKFQQNEIWDAMSSSDGKYFVVSSADKQKCTIYNSNTLEALNKFDVLYDNMRFSVDSQLLVITSGDSWESKYNVYVVRLRDGQEALLESQFEITNEFGEEVHEIKAVDISQKYQEIYIACGPAWKKRMLIYDFTGACKQELKQIRSLAVSPNENLVALGHEFDKLVLWHSQSGKKISEIQTQGVPTNIQWYKNSSKVITHSPRQIAAYDIYSHEVIFQIDVETNPWGKLMLVNQEFLIYEDTTSSLNIFDLNYKAVRAQSEILKKYPLNIKFAGDTYNTNTAWCQVAGKLMIQLTDQLVLLDFPYISADLKAYSNISRILVKQDGHFIPVLTTTKNADTSSFSKIFDKALDKQDIEVLSIPTYPYQVSAFHYFALSRNSQGIEFCFKNGIKFLKDIFGNNPLDYALETKDQPTIRAVITGILKLDQQARREAMEQLPLQQILKEVTPDLEQLLNQGGVCVPQPYVLVDCQKLGQNYPLKEDQINFSLSTVPLYSPSVAKDLHPPINCSNAAMNMTEMFTNPVPKDFSLESIELLKHLEQLKEENILMTKPVLYLLYRKWNDYGYWFFLIQLALHSLQLALLTTIWLTEFKNVAYILTLIELPINSYFLLYEVVKFIMQGKQYLLQGSSTINLFSIGLIYAYLLHVLEGTGCIQEGLALIFLILWGRFLKGLQVFKSFRYQVSMAEQAIKSSKVFILVLILAYFAYGQILISLNNGKNNYITEDAAEIFQINQENVTISFVLKLLISILLFVFVPFVLVGVLISQIQGANSQKNYTLFDAKALVKMVTEQEEILRFFKLIFSANSVKSAYFYSFYTKTVTQNDLYMASSDIQESIRQDLKEQTSTIQQLLNEHLEKIEAKHIHSSTAQPLE